ncbi:hypothetical protein P872_08905 [Rhodonellum psychrophilum GCM71 = DSM 17998]|uniref:Uncharacterized protein n=1 Tax=Rhodonellum psychrophilum GCM71 = DSM 17998 TaxID=1123057 RepID=U5BMV4_9BACT|nr:hypothetical protein P872_08905 [Rhodonellum psychrophilum GCM71 = DSM 17998]
MKAKWNSFFHYEGIVLRKRGIKSEILKTGLNSNVVHGFKKYSIEIFKKKV